jgi:hypothetical protein
MVFSNNIPSSGWGISLWNNDTINSIVITGQFSNEVGDTALGGPQCSGSLENIYGNLYGQTPNMGTPALIGNGQASQVSGDGDLFVGLDVASSNAQCWENVGLSVQVSRCVDVNGNTYSCGNTNLDPVGGASNPGSCVLALSQNVGFSANDAQVSATQIAASPQVGSAMTTTLSVGAYAGGYQYSNGWNTAASGAYVGMNLTDISGVLTSGYGTHRFLPTCKAL